MLYHLFHTDTEVSSCIHCLSNQATVSHYHNIQENSTELNKLSSLPVFLFFCGTKTTQVPQCLTVYTSGSHPALRGPLTTSTCVQGIPMADSVQAIHNKFSHLLSIITSLHKILACKSLKDVTIL